MRNVTCDSQINMQGHHSRSIEKLSKFKLLRYFLIVNFEAAFDHHFRKVYFFTIKIVKNAKTSFSLKLKEILIELLSRLFDATKFSSYFI